MIIFGIGFVAGTLLLIVAQLASILTLVRHSEHRISNIENDTDMIEGYVRKILVKAHEL